MQSALPTGTQGEEGNTRHGSVVPLPIVGRLGTSRESGSPHKMNDRHSTTIVRVPGSSGDSGFHCESLSEDEKVKG